MILKCPFCGKQNVVNAQLYGSPLFLCNACQRLCYDSTIIEPALYPPPDIEPEKMGFFIYAGIPLGAIIALGALSGELFSLIIGLGLMIGSIALICSAHRDAGKKLNHYRSLLEDSHQRLSKLSYQEQLIVASDGNAEVITRLKEYTSHHNLDFVLDVDSILRNNANNIAVIKTIS